MHGEDLSTVSEFELQQGEAVSFSLSYQLSHLPLPSAPDVAAALQETEVFWREWIEPRMARGNWPAPVAHSLIVLRSLIYAPTGGIVASPNHFAARTTRRRTQLGLPLLLVA